MERVTVVVPAYKARYLDAALESLCQQTDDGFQIFVGDDCGDSKIESIVSSFRDRREIKYKRYSSNVGRCNPALHWNRCIDECRGEWIWLFSDDDVADKDCIQGLKSTSAFKAGSSHALIRFNTRVINSEGEILRINPPHPGAEPFIATIYHKLNGVRESYAVEYVFKREAWERNGGFARLPLAWCADDASWLGMSRGHEVITTDRGHVNWRKSSANISAVQNSFGDIKFSAISTFLDVCHPQLVQWCRSENIARSAVFRWVALQAFYLGPSRRTVSQLFQDELFGFSKLQRRAISLASILGRRGLAVSLLRRALR